MEKLPIRGDCAEFINKGCTSLNAPSRDRDVETLSGEGEGEGEGEGGGAAYTCQSASDQYDLGGHAHLLRPSAPVREAMACQT